MKPKKNKKLLLFLQLLVVVVFLGLIGLSAYLYRKLGGRTGNFLETIDIRKEVNLETEEAELVWVDYVDEEYGFSFSKPKFLTENKFEGSGDYLSFTRFEATQFSKARGVSVGVRENSLSDEVMKIKSEVDMGFNVKLTQESKIKADDFTGVKLDYEPVGEGELEARSFIILEKDGFAISISTTPEQIERIISSFMFL